MSVLRFIWRLINPFLPASLRERIRSRYRATASDTRRQKLLAGLNSHDLSGVEIGALASPLVKPEDGRILYVDYTDTASLKEKYRHDPNVVNENIVDVGAIWGSQSLQDCIGTDTKVDYVLASHVIEHVPDLITWLAEIHAILKPGGSLRLAVPDRRYSFDYLRFETRIHDVLDAYLRRARVPLPRLIIEFNSLARVVDCRKAWDGVLDPAHLQPMGTKENGLSLAAQSLADGSYHDVHCWVFTPKSFAELCTELAELDLLNFACDSLIETARGELEFFVSMLPCKGGKAAAASWRRAAADLK